MLCDQACRFCCLSKVHELLQCDTVGHASSTHACHISWQFLQTISGFKLMAPHFACSKLLITATAAVVSCSSVSISTVWAFTGVPVYRLDLVYVCRMLIGKSWCCCS